LTKIFAIKRLIRIAPLYMRRLALVELPETGQAFNDASRLLIEDSLT
jgi:hypothetical protein